MSEPKFTPGPWKVGKSIYQSQARVVAEKGGRIADVFAYEEDQAHANAVLIAVAPEMCDVLQHYLDLLERANKGDEIAECKLFEDMVEIEQVLKKARGEA